MRTIKTGIALALLLCATLAQAAGLGKLTVNSSLGQILNAEIDLVSVQAGELESINARVAPPEAFRDARIEYASSLRLLRFSVEKRPNGQAYLKVTSVAPINEPFVDALIELTWPQGRIQREYPILLDPPGYGQGRVAAPAVAAAPSAAPQTPPATEPAASSATPAAPAASSAPTTEPSGTPSARGEMAATPSAAPADAPAATAGGDTYGPVQKGDTLAKIATELKPADVSLEQMLVALYRENKSAFVNNNMNRLKAGQILKVPSASDVQAVESREARTEYRTHVADWRAYREQLAGGVAAAPATSSPTPASSSGTIASAAVTPPAAPSAPPKDVLKLSKSDAGSGKAAGAGKGGGATQERLNALQEELTAKDKALSEANSRVADLEKQIRDMQRLMDLKAGAPKADTKVATAPTAVPAPTKAPEPPKVDAKKAEPAKPADTKVATAPTTPAAPAKAPEPAKVEPTKPADATKPAEPPKAAEAKPAPPKTATKAPPKKGPAPPEKGFVDELMDNPLVFWGGLGLLALAIGGGAFAFIRKRRAQSWNAGGTSSTMGSAFPSDLKVDQATGKPGGGLVDTGNSSFLTDFDKTGPGTIDTDEVDPVAEAEVYIAYGRDAQAEEILKEAMARDKSRPEIALKLLEIYHARKSATAFETVAKELHGSVGDSHPMWQKAAAMGAQIDPNNPLYAGAAASGTGAFVAAAPAAAPDVDFDIETSKGGSGAPAPDFDLNTDTKTGGTSPSGLDFDIAPSTPAPEATAEPEKEDKPAFDFDLSGLDFPGSKPAGSSTDLDLEASRPAPGAPALNLSDLSLDSPSDTSAAADSGGGEGVGTKLELAKAYLEIGDKDGAREILQEVAKEGSAAQKEEAQKLISQL